MYSLIFIKFLLRFILFVTLLKHIVRCEAKDEQLMVNLSGQGIVLGGRNKTIWTQQNYMQFLGIPYAEAPSGCLRFKPPVPRKPWQHPLNATTYGRICPQLFTYNRLPAASLTGDLEDCLSINVFTKNLHSKQPVMFYIHGGSFYVGFASDYPPGYLLEQDIVLVVVQYRLGVLGFTGTRTADMPGNLGVMDITLALQWVQQHIAAFGGDPAKVTIFGESAGGELGGLLMLSPKTPVAYFERLITQSGTVLAKESIELNSQQQVERICRALGCRRCERQTVQHHCLEKASVMELLNATQQERFGLIIGDYHGILPQHPQQLVENNTRCIPLMTGFTKHDGSLLLGWHYDTMKQLHGNLSALTVGEFASPLMDWMNDTTGLANNMLTRLLFPVDLWNSYDHKRALPAYFDLVNVLFFKSPIIGLTNRLLRRNCSTPIFFYTFDYSGAETVFGFDTGNAHYPFNGGVHHVDDLLYLFPMRHLNEDDTLIAKKMVQLWTSFASSGAPISTEDVNWKPMETIRGPYLHINMKLTIGKDVLDEFTATLDDPDNAKLNREDINF